MTGFRAHQAEPVPLDAIPDEKILRLVDYWSETRGGQPFLRREDFDPTDLPGLHWADYGYIRVALPMSYGGEACDALLVMSNRVRNENLLFRR